MAEPLSLSGWLLAQFLPWACGAVWVRWLLLRTGRCNLGLILGHGFFLGIFLATLLLRLWDVAGLQLAFAGPAALLGALGVAGVLLQLRSEAAPGPVTAAAPRWHYLLAAVVLALLGWRYLTLGQELWLRPLYAWDAWMNWAPKAIVWFHLGEMVDYVKPYDWLTAAADDYTLGNRQAWNYPVTVPLIQLWSMLGAGTWDHGGIYFAWLFAPLALGLALFGHLRLAGVSLAWSCVALYLLLSLPYLNVHTVLAGYADIWVAAAFALGVCALSEWQRERRWQFAVLWLVMALLCTQLKVPGLILGLILLACGLRAWLSLPPLAELGAALVLVVGALALVALRVSVDLPYLGHVSLAFDRMEIGRIGAFEPALHPVGGVFAQTFLVMTNWHLLGYLLPLVLLYALWRKKLLRYPGADVLAVILGVCFVTGVFLFTGHYTQALNFVTLNRALLYPVPALVFVCCLHLAARPPGGARA